MCRRGQLQLEVDHVLVYFSQTSFETVFDRPSSDVYFSQTSSETVFGRPSSETVLLANTFRNNCRQIVSED